MNGYTDKILVVELTNENVRTISTQEYIGRFVGGRGIGVKLAYELMPGGVNPLRPENVLVFMTGPLTGTPAPSSGRIDVIAKSPETGLLGGANAGGFFGPELKYAGYDGIVIVGEAASPVYIDIFNDDVTIKNAQHLWGKGVFDTVQMLRKGDEDVQVACIGPAGEKLVNLSGIAFSMRNYAARGGLGAVMGSKKLKAIAVRGTKGLDIAKADGLIGLVGEMQDRIKMMPSYQEYPEWHYKLFEILESDSKSFFGNYEDKFWEDRFQAYKNAKRFIKHVEFKPETCFGCPLRCWAYINVKNVGASSIAACQGTLTSLANFTKVKDFGKIWKAYRMCQDLGLDTSGTSAVMAYAMDLYSKGILTNADTEGLVLDYGNGDALVQIVEKIVTRRGLGNILADGVKKASEVIGKGAEKRAVYGKGGLELWLMEIRPFKGVALSCAVTDSGSQNRATYGLCEFYYKSMKKQAEMVAKNLVGTEEAAIPTKYEHKPKLVAMYENLHILADSLGVCSIPFMPVGLELWARAYGASTGMEATPKALMLAAERIRTLERLFNIREGLIRKDDMVTERMFNEPLKDGAWKGEVLNREKFEQMKDAYYALRGWDSEGRPKQETLEKLGLE
ncbi:MAG: aldehyde ferredoxin oxidoreductase family protein [Candidatus Hadarchaeaceae archaeon]